MAVSWSDSSKTPAIWGTYGIKSAVRSLWYWNVCFVSRHILYFIPIWTAYSVCRGIFDGSLCSRQRVRTLKRDLRKVLNGLPFDIVRSSADCLRLVRTDGHPLLEEGETDNM